MRLTIRKERNMKKFDERTEYILTQLGLAIESKDWETVSSLITLNPETMALALECTYNHLPDEYKFSIPTECYTHHGDSMPTVRKYVRVARKFMPDAKRIPTEFLSMQEIQVYRAGEEEIGKARYQISWTTDFAVAKWFGERAIAHGFPPRHLYAAKIKPEKIICYTDDRNEKEVMQYNSVTDVVEIGVNGLPL